MRNSILLHIGSSGTSLIFVSPGSIRGCSNTLLGTRNLLNRFFYPSMILKKQFHFILRFIEGELFQMKKEYFHLAPKKTLFGSPEIFATMMKKKFFYYESENVFPFRKFLTDKKLEGFINRINLEISSGNCSFEEFQKDQFILINAIILKAMKIFNCNKLRFSSPDVIPGL